jgi:hypothetical protein
MKCTVAGLMLLLCSSPLASLCQGQDSSRDKISNFPVKLFQRTISTTSDLEHQLTTKTTRYLSRMSRVEQKLRARLFLLDSAKATAFYLSDPRQDYTLMAQNLRQDSTKVVTSMGPEYLPNVDSLAAALSFLNKNPTLANLSPGLQTKIQTSIGQLQQLQAKLQDADVIKQYLQTRKAQIAQYLSQWSHLPSSITNCFQQYKTESFYFAEQVRQYRQVLNDPNKITTASLLVLNKIPLFVDFMRRNSFLAGLFNVPSNYGSADGLSGLETRDQVTALIQNQVGQGGASAISTIQQSLQSAQQDIDRIRNKLSSLGAGSGDIDMPDFKPNDQRTRTFFKRLEYGTSFQTTPTSYFFPSTVDLGLSVGYKISTSKIVGVGASYKLGFGNGFKHIAFSNQGVGLRSFVNVNVKGTWGTTAGFEYNYQQPFAAFQDLHKLNSWTKSGIVGITKTVAIKGHVFKKTVLQFLWDYFSYQQIPKTQPVIFRVGYNL